MSQLGVPLYLKPVPEKGLGVFCGENIAAGTLIDAAPVIFFNEEDARHIDKTHLYNYYFSTQFLPEKDASKAGCLAMGMLSFCNHADDPNAVLEKTVEEHGGMFYLKAVRDIPAGEEITIAYGKLWFEAV